ncbi:succinate dehydrogenase assembly factor 2, mitochondrial-like [Prorops nasuta]|uniref:succinate dehydrogenase assembly factor 2, mitochondrial-like n=1 Tax=Prorops nasuta TaxID=863751 RepID=UPI0034CF46D1
MMNFVSSSIVKHTKNFTITRGISKMEVKFKNTGDFIRASNEGFNKSIHIEHQEEKKDVRKARLIYQSRQRGILENCLLLGTFANKYLDGFNEKQLQMYDNLINAPSNDWDIYYWAIEHNPVPPEFDNEIMDLLKEHTRNKNMEIRNL